MSDPYSLQKISLIEDDYGNIIQWAVWKEEDVHKNYIEYEYDNFKVQGLSGDNTNLNGGQYFHIKRLPIPNPKVRTSSIIRLNLKKKAESQGRISAFTAKEGSRKSNLTACQISL